MHFGECRPRSREVGFTYIGVLVLIALLGFMLAAAGQVAGTAAQREREKELIFIGHEYRNAIARFYRHNRRYPMELAELLESTGGGPQPAHYLRRLYRDPMTHGMDWILLSAPNQGIMGIASASQQVPLKQAGFDDDDFGFEQASTYADWQFLYDPQLRRVSGQEGVRGINTLQLGNQPH
jgi:type II secretory pathway pseudopilin PulG